MSKYSDFYRMTPAQKETYIERMMPCYRALKKSLQKEIKDYVLNNPKLLQRYPALAN